MSISNDDKLRVIAALARMFRVVHGWLPLEDELSQYMLYDEMTSASDGDLKASFVRKRLFRIHYYGQTPSPNACACLSMAKIGGQTLQAGFVKADFDPILNLRFIGKTSKQVQVGGETIACDAYAYTWEYLVAPDGPLTTHHIVFYAPAGSAAEKDRYPANFFMVTIRAYPSTPERFAPQDDNPVTEEAPKDSLLTTQGNYSASPNHTVHQQISGRQTLYVIFYYNKGPEPQFRHAGLHKRKRLYRQYDMGNIIVWVFPFYISTEIQAVWSDIRREICDRRPQRYTLADMHIFAHGSEKAVHAYRSNMDILKVSQTAQSVGVDTLAPLPWQPGSALVLHACNTGHLNFTDKDFDQVKGQRESCIAQAFSKQLGIKGVGQQVTSSFNTGDTFDELRYRSSLGFSSVPAAQVALGYTNLALWGYKSGSVVLKGCTQREGYDMLATNQIWPCRVFENGSIGTPIYYSGSLVTAPYFNDADRQYI